MTSQSAKVGSSVTCCPQCGADQNQLIRMAHEPVGHPDKVTLWTICANCPECRTFVQDYVKAKWMKS